MNAIRKDRAKTQLIFVCGHNFRLVSLVARVIYHEITFCNIVVMWQEELFYLANNKMPCHAWGFKV
jgi:hypothetical protein